MAKQSTQHKLDRVRPPRVHVTYDVEVGDAIELKELPFVMGVLGDFTGQPTEPLPRLRDRPAAARPPRGRDADLPGLRRHHPQLLLRPVRIRRAPAHRTPLRTMHPYRQNRSGARRRHRASQPGIEAAGRRAHRDARPLEGLDVAPQLPSTDAAIRSGDRPAGPHPPSAPPACELADRRLPA